MQLNKDQHHGDYVIKRYEDGKITINENTYTKSLVISATQLIESWPPNTLEELQSEHFSPIITLKPEVVLLGTGKNLVFPDQAVLAPLYDNNIGVEVMDTLAACRTFNVLMAESRHAVAAVII